MTTEHGALLHEQLFAGTGQALGGMPEAGGRSIYVSVCLCVWFCGHGGWWAGMFGLRKKRQKKRRCASRVLVVAASKPAYAGALGQTYVRQLLPVAPPRFTLFGLVAVAVLADTMFN